MLLLREAYQNKKRILDRKRISIPCLYPWNPYGADRDCPVCVQPVHVPDCVYFLRWTAGKGTVVRCSLSCMIAGYPLTFICCAALSGPGLWASVGYGSAPLGAFNVASSWCSILSAVAALASVVDLSSSSTAGPSSTWISHQYTQFQSASDRRFC